MVMRCISGVKAIKMVSQIVDHAMVLKLRISPVVIPAMKLFKHTQPKDGPIMLLNLNNAMSSAIWVYT